MLMLRLPFMDLSLVIRVCVAESSCLTLCNPMDCSTQGFLILHYLLEFTHIYVCCIGDAI